MTRFVVLDFGFGFGVGVGVDWFGVGYIYIVGTRFMVLHFLYG